MTCDLHAWRMITRTGTEWIEGKLMVFLSEWKVEAKIKWQKVDQNMSTKRITFHILYFNVYICRHCKIADTQILNLNSWNDHGENR